MVESYNGVHKHFLITHAPNIPNPLKAFIADDTEKRIMQLVRDVRTSSVMSLSILAFRSDCEWAAITFSDVIKMR